MNNIYRHLILGSGGSNTPPPTIGNLVMTFSDFNSLPSGITDVTDLGQWNATFISNYTSINIAGYRISLIGGSGVILPEALFLDNESILMADDSGSVIEAHESSFENSINLQNLTLPECVFIGAYALGSCTAMATCYLPKCTNLGGTVGNDSVFNAITGSTITLTIPTSLMTCDGGNPDGDIATLDGTNSVTIVTV